MAAGGQRRSREPGGKHRLAFLLSARRLRRWEGRLWVRERYQPAPRGWTEPGCRGRARCRARIRAQPGGADAVSTAAACSEAAARRFARHCRRKGPRAHRGAAGPATPEAGGCGESMRRVMVPASASWMRGGRTSANVLNRERQDCAGSGPRGTEGAWGPQFGCKLAPNSLTLGGMGRPRKVAAGRPWAAGRERGALKIRSSLLRCGAQRLRAALAAVSLAALMPTAGRRCRPRGRPPSGPPLCPGRGPGNPSGGPGGHSRLWAGKNGWRRWPGFAWVERAALLKPELGSQGARHDCPAVAARNRGFGTTCRRPHVGIYAIIARGSAWLLIRKARGPYAGRLDLPGGTPKAHESPVEALTREVEEETGVRVEEVQPLGAVTLAFPYAMAGGIAFFHHRAILFTGTRYDARFARQDSRVREDAQGCLWVNPKAVAGHRRSPLVSAAVKRLLRAPQKELPR